MSHAFVQVAKLSVPDARTITLQPFEEIYFTEKAIMVANIGFNQ
jgi:ribosome recycling factor